MEAVHNIGNFPHENILTELNLHSTERRRARGDLLKVLKWYRSISYTDRSSLLKVNNLIVLGKECSNGFKLINFDLKKESGRH